MIEETKHKIKLSKHPFFEILTDPRTRCLAAVLLGCDVYPSGIRQLNKPQFYKHVTAVVEEHHCHPDAMNIILIDILEYAYKLCYPNSNQFTLQHRYLFRLFAVCGCNDV
jgi:hypothetical protein